MDVGPVVIMATVLIAGGIGTTMLSKLPTVALYGTIVVIVLTSAVIGALAISSGRDVYDGTVLALTLDARGEGCGKGHEI